MKEKVDTESGRDDALTRVDDLGAQIEVHVANIARLTANLKNTQSELDEARRQLNERPPVPGDETKGEAKAVDEGEDEEEEEEEEEQEKRPIGNGLQAMNETPAARQSEAAKRTISVSIGR